MQQWEYQFVPFLITQQGMNDIGVKGWEFICLLKSEIGDSVLVFKRPLKPVNEPHRQFDSLLHCVKFYVLNQTVISEEQLDSICKTAIKVHDKWTGNYTADKGW